jgi:hypothetical protein
MIGVLTNLKKPSCLEIREFRDFSFALVSFARQELLTRIEFKAVHLRLCHLLSTPGSSATASHMSRTAASKCGFASRNANPFIARPRSQLDSLPNPERSRQSQTARITEMAARSSRIRLPQALRGICPFRAIRARGGRELTLERGCIVNGRAIS